MLLIQPHHIKPNTQQFKDIVVLSDVCKKLYNECIKYIKQFQIENDGNLYRLNDDGKNDWCFNNTHLFHRFKNTQYFNVQYNGKRINTRILNQVFFEVNHDFSSFLRSIKSYYQDKSKYKKKPKQPSFKSNKAMMTVTIPSGAYSTPKLRDYGLLTGISNSSISIDVNNLKDKGHELRQIQLTPCSYGYIANVCYINNSTKEESVKPKKVVSRICGIDIGLSNLASVTFNTSDIQPFLIDGKKLDNINTFYFKKKAILKSKLSKGLVASKQLDKLYLKRYNKINGYLHKASSMIINHLVSNNIDCLVVGSNKDWKQKINIGRNNNRRFCSIPFDKFKKLLEYKCEMNGILYIDREESYTSKCSFIDMETISKKDEYLGKRFKRGLFKSNSGKIINSDINGSLNIIRKEFGNEYFNWDTVYKLYSNVKRVFV